MRHLIQLFPTEKGLKNKQLNKNLSNIAQCPFYIYAMLRGGIQEKQIISKGQLRQTVEVGKKKVLNSYGKQRKSECEGRRRISSRQQRLSAPDAGSGAMTLSAQQPAYQPRQRCSATRWHGSGRNKRRRMQGDKSYRISYAKPGKFIKTPAAACECWPALPSLLLGGIWQGGVTECGARYQLPEYIPHVEIEI